MRLSEVRDDDMSGKTLEMTMLYDFFGDLLTDKQREYFDLYYNEDLSLGEIAENAGITRQGVRDMIARAEASLRDIERKTGVVRRFGEIREGAARAEAMAMGLSDCCADPGALQNLNDLLALLRELKG